MVSQRSLIFRYFNPRRKRRKRIRETLLTWLVASASEIVTVQVCGAAPSGRAVAGIADSNPAEDIDVRLLFLLCVV